MSPLPGLGWGLLRWAPAPRAWADTPPWTAVHGVPSPSPTLTLGRVGLLPSPPRGVCWDSEGRGEAARTTAPPTPSPRSPGGRSSPHSQLRASAWHELGLPRATASPPWEPLPAPAPLLCVQGLAVALGTRVRCELSRVSSKALHGEVLTRHISECGLIYKQGPWERDRLGGVIRGGRALTQDSGVCGKGGTWWQTCMQSAV